jgi:hypothetical protein
MDPASIGREVKKLYPQYAKVDDATIGQKYLSKYGAAVSGVSSGQLKISDIPEAQRPAVSLGLTAGGYKAMDPKTDTALKATDNLVSLMEQRFAQAGGGEYTGAGARVSGVKKGVEAKLGLNDTAKVYDDQRKGFAATLKQLTGDTGVLTDQDYARLSGLIPSLGATPGEAEAKFSDLRSQIAAKFGGQSNAAQYKAPQSKGGLLASLLPGVAEKTKELQQQSQAYADKPSIGGLAKLTYETSPLSVVTNPKSRAATDDLATVLGLLEGAGALKKGLSTITEKGALANRAAAANSFDAKLSADNIIKTAEKRLSSASEADAPQVRKILETAKSELKGKNFTAQEILDKLAEYNKAYSTTGKAGKSAKAFFNDAMSKAVREELKTKAPDVFKAQELLKAAKQRPKNIMKILGLTGSVAGGVGGSAYLLSQIFGKK